MSTESLETVRPATTATSVAGRPAGWSTSLDVRRADLDFFERHWRDIMRGRPPETAEYLIAERQVAEKLIDDGGYRGVVEAGCADGTLLMPVVVVRGLDYLGIDLAGAAVALAQQALTEHGSAVGASPGNSSGARSPRRVAAIEGDIRNLPNVAPELLPAEPRLVAFPFNVLGNIPTPRAALRAAASCDADVLVLTYQTSRAATAVRRAYYQACGFDGGFRADHRGVHFTAGLFTSSVYRRDLLVRWLEELGYRVEIDRFAEVGAAYHGRRSSG